MRGVGTILLNPVGTMTLSGANTVVVQNGTNGQAFTVYNTTDGTNTEFGELRWTGNVFFVGSNVAGSGSARVVTFEVGGTRYFDISTAILRPSVDLTSAIGDATHRLTDLQTKQITLGQTIANATVGEVTLSGATGSAIVYTSAVSATSTTRIFLSKVLGRGTQGHVSVTTSIAANQFTIASSSTTDTSVVAWWLVPTT